jgi:hypothetical protein
MDKLTLTFERDLEMGTEVSALKTARAELEHGDSWPRLVNDFVAFLRGTGYVISHEWVEHYLQLETAYNVSRNITCEDEVGHTANGSRNVRTSSRKRSRKFTKKKKKKAKAKK